MNCPDINYIDEIALTFIPKIGPVSIAHLIDCFGSATEILNATIEQLIEIAKMSKEVAAGIKQNTFRDKAEKEWKYCVKNNITPIIAYQKQYPKLLKECNDYPHILYAKGNTDVLNSQIAVSVVGTRRISKYGKYTTSKIITELAQFDPNMAVVSGIALGVDALAHRTAIDNNLKTVAVIPDSLRNISPQENIPLAKKIIENGGVVVSEYDSTFKAHKGNFQQRNRIIAGLSPVTIITQSPIKGGAMITAYMANGYNRCVFTCPANIDEESAQGNNQLIKKNIAFPISNAMDIVEEMGWMAGKEGDVAVNSDSDGEMYDSALHDKISQVEQSVLQNIKDNTIDQIAEITKIPVSQICIALINLELLGIIKPLPGKMFMKVR